MGLFLETVTQYKSSFYEVARGLLRSRRNQANRAESLSEQLRLQKELHSQLERQQLQTQRQLQQTREQLCQAQQENQRLRNQTVVLPDDPPLPNQSYGPRMISLCIRLAKRVGFRASVDALKILLDWLGIKSRIPCWTSVRTWLCRVGVDRLHQSIEPHEDWIWMADHSNQIGKEKVLTILGIGASKLPPPGQTLRHEDVHVLAVVPGTQWKREDVREQYAKLAARTGLPKMLLTDGAVELRESADVLEKPGEKLVLLRDMKHFAANALERLIGNSERFQEFLALLGRSRSAIQQTELSHFTPPPQKPKARFMNLEPTLRWGEMILWHLAHPDSASRNGITAGRMNEKLGWVDNYRQDIASWSRCQAVIGESLKFINTQGLYRGASKDLQARLDRQRSERRSGCKLSDQMSTTLIDFVEQSGQQLSSGQRGWLSTEILESSFGLYKGLEGQHSKGGFTSLLASFAALLHDCTALQVRASFRRVKVKDLKAWVTQNLGTSLSSKRCKAYRESTNPTPVTPKPG